MIIIDDYGQELCQEDIEALLDKMVDDNILQKLMEEGCIYGTAYHYNDFWDGRYGKLTRKA